MINMSSERTAMQKRLYEASLSGSVSDFERLEREDPLILNRAVVSLSPPYFDSETPLHVAALCGHSDFTRALLSRKPRLATELDSTRCTPLHLASAEGHIEIVRQLLDVTHDVCEARDEDGRTPLHLAAMKGRVEVMKQLIRARPESIREKIEGRGGGGETVLHLCVKYNRLEALRTLVDELRSRNEITFVNSEDNGGNTVLHLAAALKQLNTIEYLLQVESVKQDPNRRNLKGFTALDVAEHCPIRDLKHMEICLFLQQAGVRRAQDLGTPLPTSPVHNPQTQDLGTPLPTSPGHNHPTSPVHNPQTHDLGTPLPTSPVHNPQTQDLGTPLPTSPVHNPPTLPVHNPQTQDLGTPLPTSPVHNPQIQLNFWNSISRYWNKYFKIDKGWFKEVRGHLITASTLTTTMAYQAGLSPPGSVWQDGPQQKNQIIKDSHTPGTSILASNNDSYPIFLLFNTVSLIASLSTLLLALSGFPPENKVLLFLLISTMFCTITSMTFAYLLTLGMISPPETSGYAYSIAASSLFAWDAICIFVIVLHISRFFTWLWQKYQNFVQNRWPTRQPTENHVLSTQNSVTNTGTFSISM